MNSFARILLCCFFVSLLSGCACYKGFVKHKHEQAMCKVECKQRLAECTQTCHNNCPECRFIAKQRAKKRYGRYIHQKHVEGGMVILGLNSYRDPLQCRKTTCDCPTDYRVCIQSCSGKIPGRLQVAPAC